MRTPQSLHLRLFLPFFLALVTAVTLSWWIATSMLTQTLESRLGKQLQRATDVLIHSGFPLSRDLLQHLANLIDAEIALTGPQGDILLFTSNDPDLGRAILNNLQTVRDQKRPLLIQAGGTPYKLTAQALPESRDPRFSTVVIAASLGDIQSAAQRTALNLGLATLAGILFLAWVGHRITLSITNPVERLSRMADSIASGERDLHVALDQQNELGTLANALNRMTQRLKTYEQEIAERNRLAALGEMSARIAHEIRNPLTAMKLELQLLSESVQGAAKESTIALLAEVQRLELIAGSTLQAGRRPSAPALGSISLNDPVAEVLQLFKGQLSHRHIELDMDLAPALPTIRADCDWIKQILVNLLVNAADALPGGGRILVATCNNTSAETVTLTVADSGPGIPASRRANLFNSGASGKAGGFGIGLSLSRELTERLGGRIQLCQTHLQGACFKIDFPMENSS